MRRGRDQRQQELQQLLLEQPLLTDEEIAARLRVSVATIRLDRLQLAIPEWRERVRQSIDEASVTVRALQVSELVGELLDLQLNRSGLSILESTAEMAFSHTQIIRSHVIYAMAESLALAIIDAEVALVGVASIRYRSPALAGERLVAKGDLIEDRGSSKIIHVRVSVQQREVFRGKFLLELIR
ncbi:MAG: transcription factor FapR [Symbiobacteriaceae bacterium]|nr:transcription factor FapR [Symbiobacteriaceae bacterium]